MVRCVVVEIDKLEETRKYLSSLGVINKNYKIETANSVGYIPVVTGSDLSEFDTEERELTPKETGKSVSEILGYNPTYEWLGDIVLLKEDENLDSIVNAFLESNQSPRAILNKVSKIKGDERVRDWDLLHGDTSETVHTENGYDFKLDIRKTYFSPRLATERRRVSEMVDDDELVVDMFAGVGPYSIQMAGNGAEVIATDINQDAVQYLRHNAKRNNVENRVKAFNADVREIADDYTGAANKVVMNLPHSAHEFIDSAVKLVKSDGIIMYYCFLNENDSRADIISRLEDNSSMDVTFNIPVLKEVRPYAAKVNNVYAEIEIDKSESSN